MEKRLHLPFYEKALIPKVGWRSTNSNTKKIQDQIHCTKDREYGTQDSKYSGLSTVFTWSQTTRKHCRTLSIIAFTWRTDTLYIEEDVQSIIKDACKIVFDPATGKQRKWFPVSVWYMSQAVASSDEPCRVGAFCKGYGDWRCWRNWIRNARNVPDTSDVLDISFRLLSDSPSWKPSDRFGVFMHLCLIISCFIGCLSLSS